MTTIFKSMLLTSLRDKITLFYSALLPIGLLMGLGFYFDNAAYSPRLLTGVIALSSLFWGLSGVAFQVHWQRSRGVYKLLKLTPLPTIHFIFFMTIARTILGIFINLLILATGMVLFEQSISVMEFFLGTIVMFIGILCFTCFGFLVSNFANNEGQINMISNLFFFPMIFGSDTFYSLENAPAWVVKMGEIFPFSHYLHALRASYGMTTDSLGKPLIILVLYTIALLVLASFTFKWEANSHLQAQKVRSNKGSVV